MSQVGKAKPAKNYPLGFRYMLGTALFTINTAVLLLLGLKGSLQALLAVLPLIIVIPAAAGFILSPLLLIFDLISVERGARENSPPAA